MDRRQLLGAIGAMSVAPVIISGNARADHAADGSPMTGPHAHFCGIHMAKKDPKLQFITQHYCTAHTGGSEGDVLQCVLFDSMGKNARLIGIEYLISDAAYRELPEAEKPLWHAHTYEVLGGGLIAPAMTPEEESKFMKLVLTMWGKAWHTWPDPSTPIPMGEPLLIWSLMGEGQVDEKLLRERDKQFNVDTNKIQVSREKEFGFRAPNVAVPAAMSTIGRQWTNSGPDKPTPTT